MPGPVLLHKSGSDKVDCSIDTQVKVAYHAGRRAMLHARGLSPDLSCLQVITN